MGANDFAGGGADVGQYGADPCGTGAAFGGHFRAQDARSNSGKILRVDVSTSPAAVSVWASGLHNPWRLAWAAIPPARGAAAPGAPSLFALDTGGANTTTDEINGPITAGVNLGWPCVSGNGAPTPFTALGAPACAAGAAIFMSPLFAFEHPDGPGTFSALAYHPVLARWVFADYTAGAVYSFDVFEGAKTLASAATLTKDGKFTYGVDLLWDAASAQMFVLDVVKGSMTTVAVGKGALVNPASTNGASGASAAALGVLMALGAAVAAATL